VTGPPPDITEVLFEPDAIRAQVARVAREILADHPSSTPVLIGVLKSAVVFMADLLRAIERPVVVDFVSIGGYGRPTPSGVVRIRKDLDTNIEDRDVVVVEGVVDTGLTLSYLLRNFRTRQPRSLRVCAFLNKRAGRAIDLRVDYHAFESVTDFVVGYGLDYRERYRNLPVVGVLSPAVLGR
jgi:hypoxanthine phosphoribosyltransferase